ncbi:MAG TPA: Wzz/FepE/Etk N-terminal domain-containing protein [Rhodocyclaceae bacterium]|jgi:polysaccharide chain length determinant protein (PEP-CTERM system associated)|nr:Wzz/FepE/Etk N-terminal domain-containing protein [Rhodocyclaceae bacterium]HMW76577.1 Wzz/FepE/Etk N-terminal domain-containing protein [Rhodocyclaceae bacterium]HNL20420.1 Wzz/FepE/Etk N-terminal domain-containing protein [Rhodocyclaceae bacterium]HNM21055.1 Wzz/FepE/Etk N-terminal domain-containing protein [Rhodocyclaceae bacterium]HNM80936.1 Wzz/FepE/Etk N-terminal domain-containing protein [Rhodocyclaceae bacterium]
MEDVLRQLQALVKATWRHRWVGLAVAWVVGLIGAGVLLRVPDKYEASARIYVDTQSILKPLMSGLAVQPNVEQQVMMLSRTLISRPNVEKLIRMADLDLGSNSKTQQDELTERLMKTLEIKSTNRDNLYTLAFRDTEPEKAKRVVQSLVSIFVESGLGEKRKDSDSAKKFIDDQIRAYEKKLEEAEGRLKDFKLRNIDNQTADGKVGAERLGDVSTQLAKSRLELREAENSRDAIKRQIVGEDPSLLSDSAAADVITVPELDGRIDAQKRNLDGLLQRYTEQHPDVVQTRRMIKELEEQKKQEISARKKAAAANPSVTVSNNPVYQQLKVSLAESEATVASLRTRVAEYEARYKRLTDMMKNMPEIEAEYKQLNRDYEVHRKNYDALVARRESASLTGDLESVAGIADFRLIDPPTVSNTPVAPNRLLLLPLGLLAALAAGMAAAFAMSQLRPTFVDSRTLREMTGLPLLGSVSMLISEDALKEERRGMKRFFAAFGALVGSYGAGALALFLLAPRGG